LTTKFKIKIKYIKNTEGNDIMSLEEFESFLLPLQSQIIDEDIPSYCIGFVGAPGSGKSTIAKELNKRLHLPIVISDEIRRLLESKGVNDIKEKESIVKKIKYAQISFFLEHHKGVIIDSNSLFDYKILESIFEKYHQKCFFIRVVCDEETLLQRIRYRMQYFSSKPIDFSRATEKDYYHFKEIWDREEFPLDKIFFTINTNEDIENQILNLIKKIEESF